MTALHRTGMPRLDEHAPAGFEPAACGLGNRRSILLSYERQVLCRGKLSGIAGFPVNALAPRSRDLRHSLCRSYVVARMVVRRFGRAWMRRETIEWTGHCELGS